MTREEQIHKEACAQVSVEHVPFRKYFVQGAQWADKRPRKGLVDIDKVCHFLGEYCSVSGVVIRKLRNAMEIIENK